MGADPSLSIQGRVGVGQQLWVNGKRNIRHKNAPPEKSYLKFIYPVQWTLATEFALLLEFVLGWLGVILHSMHSHSTCKCSKSCFPRHK